MKSFQQATGNWQLATSQYPLIHLSRKHLMQAVCFEAPSSREATLTINYSISVRVCTGHITVRPKLILFTKSCPSDGGLDPQSPSKLA